MSRFLLSAVSVFVLLLTTFLLPQSASACEERMPLTLLSLYRTSDSIYVGRYEKTDEGEVTEDTVDYSVVPIKKRFGISSALKGESRKMLTLEDTEYRYKNQGAVEEDSEHGESEVDEAKLVPGDLVLLFVKKNEETGAIELTETYDGIKKMTPDKLSAYEARINELKGILSTEKPKHSQIVAWLIRCAEDPLTRWEGTFELLQSFQNMDWQEERAKQQAEEKPAEEKPTADDAAEGSEEYVPEVPKEFDTGDPNFAKNVSDSQKLALTNILLKRERPAKDENGENEVRASVTLGDRELIELVKRWGDPRVASNLLEQLRQDSTDANLSYELMASIASMLKDDELTGVTDEYSNVQWESAEDEVGGGAEAEPPAVEAETTEPATQPNEVEGATKPEPVAEPASAASKEPAKKKQTYGELRTELLAKFLARADKVIAREKNRETAKVHR